MKRQILAQMREWKQKPDRKPLVLMGARQVGKTTSLLHFGQSYYTHTVYLNFEDDPKLKALFDDGLNPQTILKAIEIEKSCQIMPENTLVIFDEIQACPKALNSLKYFCEQANEYHIAAAGSLLGVKLLNTEGFPVGKVNFMEMHPLSFFEFLLALNEQSIHDFLCNITDCKPLPSNIHEKCMGYLREYLFIGGMPEAIATYIKTKSFDSVREVQQSILMAYQLDFSKHAPPNQVMRINQVWNAVPAQLAKENKKFIYSIIRKGARAQEFELAIQWLKEAGLILKTHYVPTPKMPLRAYSQFEAFKTYLVDVGLLGAISALSAKSLLAGNALFMEFKGSYTENLVAKALDQMNYRLYYWTSPGRAEVDYIIQHENDIYPIEVKSGSSNKKKSLRIYQDKYQPSIAVRVSPMNLEKRDNLLNCPLYLLERLPALL